MTDGKSLIYGTKISNSRFLPPGAGGIHDFVMRKIIGELSLPPDPALRLGNDHMAAGRQPQPVGADEGLQEIFNVGDEVLLAILA